MLLEELLPFISALALGALIGLERELVSQDRKEKKLPISEFGGVRTFMLISLFGALATYLSQQINSPLLLISSGVVVLLLFIAHYTYTLFKLGESGATTEIVAFLTFFIGVLTALGNASLAVILAIIVTTIMLSKHYVRQLLKKFSRTELTNTIRFAVLLFVILPILPNTPIDPYGVFNPQEVWYVVVLISGISYVGYIASKLIGTKKGIILSGMFGGLASSTAVTSAMSERSKKVSKILHPFVIATVVASAMMFVRVLFWVYSFNSSLLMPLIIPIVAMTASSLLVIGVSYGFMKRTSEQAKEKDKEVPLESPFEIVPALKFALFFLVVAASAEVAVRYLGPEGTYAVSLLSGLADVDAITVSLANQAEAGAITETVATRGIIIATMTNTAVKVFIARFFGGRRFARWIAVSFFVIILAGTLSLFFV